MKIRDLITEGMTFNAVVEKDYDGKKVWSSQDWETKQLETCWVCDGTGKENGYPCRRCEGMGKTEEYISTAPELQVSNSNGYEIQRMLGLTNPDYSGIIYNRDLPKIMRRLIQLKNQNTSKYTQYPSDQQGAMGKKYTDDQGITHIGRSGPRMIDMGRSQEQINRYIDTLIELVKFAQENDASISWG